MELAPITFCIVLAAVILTTATTITFLLRKAKPENATFKKVMTIIRSWWVIIAFFLGALAIGKWGVIALFLAINLAGLREYLIHSRLSYKKGLGLLLAAAIVGQYATLTSGSLLLFMAAPVISVSIIVPLTVIATNSVATLPLAFATTMGLLTMSSFMSYIPALAWLNHAAGWPAPDLELLSIALLFLLTESNDVFQFLSGKAFGRRKPLPQISPNKTEAGFIGGIVLTTMLAWATLTPLLGLSTKSALLIGATVAFVGMLGDLMFSSIKRYFGTKDFSEALPGHGGILDRMDSLILTAPVYFHLLTTLREFPL